MNPRADNPAGLDRFDPMDDPEFAAGVQAYSDRLRALRGRPRIRLFDEDPARPDLRAVRVVVKREAIP